MGILSKCHNIDDLRKVARRRLPHGLFEFIDRGCEDEVAMNGNLAAFRAYRMMPRPMIDVSARNTSSALLGREVAMPAAIAPTGAAGLCWYEGELALARAAAKFGVPFTLATASMTEMASIVEALPEGHFWFQLYMYEDPALSMELVDRASRANCETLLLTVDQTANPNREFMKKNGFSVPFRMTPSGTVDILRHPGWFVGVLMRYLATTGMPKNRNYPSGFQGSILSDPRKRVPIRNDRISWDDLAKLRDRWRGKLLVKGILRAEDAERCIAAGVDGVVVTNHGGRAFDSAPAPIDCLPAVAAAVGGRGTVLLDSGIRRGSDIAKALALGADGVLLGRSTLYGVSAGGEDGAIHALKLLHNELLDTMAFTGCKTIGALIPEIIIPAAR